MGQGPLIGQAELAQGSLVLEVAVPLPAAAVLVDQRLGHSLLSVFLAPDSGVGLVLRVGSRVLRAMVHGPFPQGRVRPGSLLAGTTGAGPWPICRPIPTRKSAPGVRLWWLCRCPCLTRFAVAWASRVAIPRSCGLVSPCRTARRVRPAGSVNAPSLPRPRGCGLREPCKVATGC
ncbi:hypothetical protein ACFSHQ_21870 [Gemmobacter lanyuensis]